MAKALRTLLYKVISGGQAGVDRAALDAAAAYGLEIGGWCPPGREADDGAIPDRYPLKETPFYSSPDAPDLPRSLRTEWNVKDSDATLVITLMHSIPENAGTAFTISCAKLFRKPYLVVVAEDLPHTVEHVLEWLGENESGILNVAGPSELSDPGIYSKAFRLLSDVFANATER